MEVMELAFMDNLIKQIVVKLVGTKKECAPESQMDKLKEMFQSLPDAPRAGKAPEWTKVEQRTDGQSGESTS